MKKSLSKYTVVVFCDGGPVTFNGIEAISQSEAKSIAVAKLSRRQRSGNLDFVVTLEKRIPKKRLKYKHLQSGSSY